MLIVVLGDLTGRVVIGSATGVVVVVVVGSIGLLVHHQTE
jgi:hypothetical protein